MVGLLAADDTTALRGAERWKERLAQRDRGTEDDEASEPDDERNEEKTADERRDDDEKDDEGADGLTETEARWVALNTR